MNRPKAWVTPFAIIDRTLVLSFPDARRVLSSAVYGGGMKYTRYVLNHQVEPNPRRSVPPGGVWHPWQDPSGYLGRLAGKFGAKGRAVGLMTAVDLRQLVLKREEAEGLWIEGFFTVGITNAIRAGEPNQGLKSDGAEVHAGTINIILVTSARLSAAAMVGAVSVATESKTAAVLEEEVPSLNGKGGATGTGTDAIVLVTGNGPLLRFSGTHTKIGELIGRIVGRGVVEGLRRVKRESQGKQV